MSGLVLGFLGLALLAQAGFVFLRSMRELRVAERRPLVLLVVLAGVGLGLLAFAREPGLLGGSAAGLTVLGGVLFLLLQPLARQSRHTPAVAVGRQVPDFTALDADGRPFTLGSLRGRPYLLKFFRGHW